MSILKIPMCKICVTEHKKSLANRNQANHDIDESAVVLSLSHLPVAHSLLPAFSPALCFSSPSLYHLLFRFLLLNHVLPFYLIMPCSINTIDPGDSGVGSWRFGDRTVCRGKEAGRTCLSATNLQCTDPSII